MKLMIASGNAHKLEELSAIFTSLGLRDVELLPVTGLFQDFDPHESGSSFLENSMIKAHALAQLLHSPEGQSTWSARYGSEPLPAVLADDSGICVDALQGAPGIYSARFGHAEAGRRLNPSEQNALLLEKLSAVPAGPRRSARYICCMTLLDGEHRVFTAQESWEGEIALEPSLAKGGFGYDPIFLLPQRGCTVADIPAAEKSRLSHRAKATRAIAALLASGMAGEFPV